MGGFAVAMPHKKSILPLLDEIDSKAKEIGSVNTVINQEGKLIGYNTDYLGICKIGLILDEGEYIVVGNGGLSASATFYLQENNLRYIMVTRSNWDYLSAVRDKVILNCTPVSLNTIHTSNKVIDFNIGQASGDRLHLLQAQEQFTLYTGLKYGT
jgi:shikimate dehydrogenase